MTNILLPSNTTIERTNLFCPAGCGLLIRGIGQMTGRALCQTCRYEVVLENAPEGKLTDFKDVPFLAQASKKKNELYGDLPPGAVGIDEFGLS